MRYTYRLSNYSAPSPYHLGTARRLMWLGILKLPLQEATALLGSSREREEPPEVLLLDLEEKKPDLVTLWKWRGKFNQAWEPTLLTISCCRSHMEATLGRNWVHACSKIKMLPRCLVLGSTISQLTTLGILATTSFQNLSIFYTNSEILKCLTTESKQTLWSLGVEPVRAPSYILLDQDHVSKSFNKDE